MMRTLRTAALLTLPALLLGLAACNQAAPPDNPEGTQKVLVGTNKSFEGANGLKITVLVVLPQEEESDLQALCFFKHKPGGDTLLLAIKDLDQDLLGGLITSLRNRGEFVGDELETLLITPPPGSIKAKKFLMVGMGDEKNLSVDVMQRVGTVVMREAVRLGAKRVAFGAAIKDQGNDQLNVGEVAGHVLKGAILAYDTEKRLQNEKLSQVALQEWIQEAGPTYFNDTVPGVEKYVKEANAEVMRRSQDPYMNRKPAPK